MSCHEQLQYKRVITDLVWNSPVRHLERQLCFQIWQDAADKNPRSAKFPRGYLEYYDPEMRWYVIRIACCPIKPPEGMTGIVLGNHFGRYCHGSYFEDSNK